jgi:lactaldehyde dehydrogenase/glycolaldehyde dehydrogenase
MESDYRMYVGGEWVKAEGERTFPVLNPANEEVIARVPQATIADAQKALQAAEKAWKDWEMLPSKEKGEHLRAIARCIRKAKNRLAEIVVREQGKTLTEARGEMDYTIGFVEYFADFARAIEGDILPADRKDESMWIMKVPFGVVVGIIPWNYPAAIFARKIAPALIAGNTIVVKPSSNTPISALEIMKLIDQETHLPKGVINVVTGRGAIVGEELVRNPITQMVSMTGSVEVGRRILELASGNFTKVSLELGGKAPFVVWNDADLDLAVRYAIRARFSNCGQVCISNERMYLHRDIAKDFIEKFLKAAEKISIGDPMKPDIHMGPLVSDEQRQKVERFVKQAIEQGAKLIIGGERPRERDFQKGYWYKPTVFTQVRQDMEIMQKEVFGPVIPVMEVSDFDETINLCNDSGYGLATYVFTKDVARVMRAVRDIRFGEFYINRPGGESFHGYHTGWRQSGLGGDDGKYGLEEYLQKKTVYLRWG